MLALTPRASSDGHACVAKINVEKQEEQLELATFEHDVHDCVADVRGQRLALTDISGRLYIFEFTFPCLYSENMQSFSVKA